MASALLVDYVLTVAVSISSAAQYAASAIPAIRGHEAAVAVAAVVVLTAMNLRGVRESGFWFAIPTYVFMVAILGMAAVGAFRALSGSLPLAESAQFTTEVQPTYEGGLATLAGAFLLLRAFSSGCAALTGVEAISNGVPAFQKPKSANAAATLAMLGVLAITMIMSILLIARQMGVVYVDEVHPERELQLDGRLGEAVGDGTVRFADGSEYHQAPIIGQIADGRLPASPRRWSGWSRSPPGSSWCWPPTPPSTASRCSARSWPGTASCRASCTPAATGWRSATASSCLAAAAIVLILAFDAEVTRLIQLYIVGVFVSFTMSQTGMIRHWTRLLRLETDPGAAGADAALAGDQRGRPGDDRRPCSSSSWSPSSCSAPGSPILAMAVLFVLMRAIRTHYDHVVGRARPSQVDPAKAACAALAGARDRAGLEGAPADDARARLRAGHPALDARGGHRRRRPGGHRGAAGASGRSGTSRCPLKALDSPVPRDHPPDRCATSSGSARASPRDLVVVYVPEYVVGHWWEQVLHNQSALRLKSGCTSRPASWWPACRGSCSRPIGAEQRLGEMLAGDAPRRRPQTGVGRRPTPAPLATGPPAP